MITEVEAVFNSRPLTYVKQRCRRAIDPLTLILMLGYRVMSPPDDFTVHCDDPYFNESPDSPNHRFKHLLTFTQKFLNRWRKEYLTELRELQCTVLAWRKVSDIANNGEVVVIHDESLPKRQW